MDIGIRQQMGRTVMDDLGERTRRELGKKRLKYTWIVTMHSKERSLSFDL